MSRVPPMSPWMFRLKSMDSFVSAPPPPQRALPMNIMRWLGAWIFFAMT